MPVLIWFPLWFTPRTDLLVSIATAEVAMETLQETALSFYDYDTKKGPMQLINGRISPAKKWLQLLHWDWKFFSASNWLYFALGGCNWQIIVHLLLLTCWNVFKRANSTYKRQYFTCQKVITAPTLWPKGFFCIKLTLFNSWWLYLTDYNRFNPL